MGKASTHFPSWVSPMNDEGIGSSSSEDEICLPFDDDADDHLGDDEDYYDSLWAPQEVPSFKDNPWVFAVEIGDH